MFMLLYVALMKIEFCTVSSSYLWTKTFSRHENFFVGLAPEGGVDLIKKRLGEN